MWLEVSLVLLVEMVDAIGAHLRGSHRVASSPQSLPHVYDCGVAGLNRR